MQPSCALPLPLPSATDAGAAAVDATSSQPVTEEKKHWSIHLGQAVYEAANAGC